MRRQAALCCRMMSSLPANILFTAATTLTWIIGVRFQGILGDIAIKQLSHLSEHLPRARMDKENTGGSSLGDPHTHPGLRDPGDKLGLVAPHRDRVLELLGRGVEHLDLVASGAPQGLPHRQHLSHRPFSAAKSHRFVSRLVPHSVQVPAVDEYLAGGKGGKYSIVQVQNGQDWGGVAELVLVLLDPDVVRAVVDVDSPVLRAQPHCRLTTFIISLLIQNVEVTKFDSLVTSLTRVQ